MRADQGVITTREVDWLTVRWSGDVDMANAKAIESQTLQTILNTDAGMALDLSDVTYIDSAGIRTVISIRRLLSERQQVFMIVLPQDSVLRKALEVGGVLSIIPSFGSQEDARAAR